MTAPAPLSGTPPRKGRSTPRLTPLALVALSALCIPSTTSATGFSDRGEDLGRVPEAEVDFGGYLRWRSAFRHNLDLDRGLTPSGEPFYPVSLADPAAQTSSGHDLRVRTDVALRPPNIAMAVKMRVDVIDNLRLGSTPEGPPSVSVTQEPIDSGFRVKRAYGEILTPIGLFAAGRMGSHWGLGIATNGGDCADCDSGDAGDRLAFVTPLAGLLWGAAFELTATGATVSDNADRAVDLEPTDAVRTLAFAALRLRGDDDRERRRRAGRTSVEYGAYVSHRWQANDIPTAWFPVADPIALDPAQVMARGFRATIVDGWFRLTLPKARVEAEIAGVIGTIDQPSLVPGVRLSSPITSRQLGAAIESEVEVASMLRLGVDGGFASGDDAPGFGAFATAGDPEPLPGDLDGPQATPSRDNTLNNFRFHPDYRIDRVFFREILGTVTDAIYVRPHLEWRLAAAGPSRLLAGLAGVGSWAAVSESTPGGARALGVEIDPTLTYENTNGFVASLEYALFLPMAGLDNPESGISARPAQSLRTRLQYLF